LPESNILLTFTSNHVYHDHHGLRFGYDLCCRYVLCCRYGYGYDYRYDYGFGHGCGCVHGSFDASC
jgi:hypothetical protein